MGVVHLAQLIDLRKEDGGTVMIENKVNFDLIVTIVNKGFAEEVVEHSKEAGAEGGTILSGRGTGVHENLKLFGISIEPEKEIVLTLIPKDKTNEVLHAIYDAVHLDKPSNGIAFVLDVQKTVGIQHLVKCGQ
jgi:nitrogen regulatory protein PII